VNEGTDDARQENVRVLDVTDPLRPRAPNNNSRRVYGARGRLSLVRSYNAPFLQHFVLAAGANGLGTMIEVSKMAATGIEAVVNLDGANGMLDLVAEELALDRLCDEEGKWIKDVSHPDCRYLTPAELGRVLRAPIPAVVEKRGTNPNGGR
jgi:hypothetical protein